MTQFKLSAGYMQDVDDATNGLPISLGTSYKNITTNTTTVVKSGAGYLHAICISTTAAGTITIYDNTAASGTKIGTLKASIAEGQYVYNVQFTTGLTIVTAASSDITVSYR